MGPGGDRTERAAPLARARDRTRLLIDVLDNLRTFATDPPTDFALEPLAPILTEAEDLARAAVTAAAAVVIRQDVAEPGLAVEANRSRLLQALVNILVNALEACVRANRPGTLTIAARRQPDGRVLITIADTGCGMTPDAVRECVQLYSTSKPGGLGFGLPLARKIIEVDHQGRLVIDSRNGVGTTVSILLPGEQPGLEG